jgi:hypothetical protein
MSAFSASASRERIGSTIAILSAIAGLALAGCSHPANNTDSSADSTAAASDSSAMATPAASDAPASSAASSTDSSMMSSSNTLSSTPSGGN